MIPTFDKTFRRGLGNKRNFQAARQAVDENIDKIRGIIHHDLGLDFTPEDLPRFYNFIQLIANRAGNNRADIIKFYTPETPDIMECFIADHVRYGYRKNTTDQYVPNAYLRNFGWKNTYYQDAITTVNISFSVINFWKYFVPAQGELVFK